MISTMDKKLKKIASLAAVLALSVALVMIGMPAIVEAEAITAPVSYGYGYGGNLFGGYGAGSLLDVLALGSLFGNAGYGYVGANTLGTLFTLNQLFSGPLSNGILTPGPTTLGNLFILDQLFR